MDIGDEVKGIPEDLGNMVKGDIKVGKLKIPKIAIAGGAIALVAFIAYKNRSKGGSSGSSGSSASKGLGSEASASGYDTSNQEAQVTPISSNPFAALPNAGAIINPSGDYSLPAIPDLSGIGNAIPIPPDSYTIPMLAARESPLYTPPYDPSKPITQTNDPTGGRGFVPPSYLPVGTVSKGKTKDSTKILSGGTPKALTPAILGSTINRTTVQPIANVVSLFTNFLSGTSKPKVPVVTSQPIPTSRAAIISMNNYKPVPLPSYNPSPSSYNSYNYYGTPAPKPVPVPVYKPAPLPVSTYRKTSSSNATRTQN